MTQSAERLEKINSHQADDYWVLVRHEVCASYLGLHVVPVPFLHDAKHYDLLNVLLAKSEKSGPRFLQRKSFFPLGPLREILASLDSKNARQMEEQTKSKSHYTDDFDHEEMVLDEGVLKSIKLIVKNVNKEDSLFFIKPEILRVSNNFPWILSVRSIYVVYEVFYTTNIQLQVSDSRLTQQFKSESRTPIGFLCRKFRLQSSGTIGVELQMNKSPCRANFVNSSSATYHSMIRRYFTSSDQLKTTLSIRSKGNGNLCRSMLSDCCLACTLDDLSPYPEETVPESESTQRLGNGDQDSEQVGMGRSRNLMTAEGEEFFSKTPWVTLTTPLPLETKRLISLMSSHPAAGGRRRSLRSAEGSVPSALWAHSTGGPPLPRYSHGFESSHVSPQSLPESYSPHETADSPTTSLPVTIERRSSADSATLSQTTEEGLPLLPIILESLSSTASTQSNVQPLLVRRNFVPPAASSYIPLIVREAATSSASTESQKGFPLPPRTQARSVVASAESAPAGSPVIKQVTPSAESAAAPAQRSVAKPGTAAESAPAPRPALAPALRSVAKPGTAAESAPAPRPALAPALRSVAKPGTSAESTPAPAPRSIAKPGTSAESTPAPAPRSVAAPRLMVEPVTPSAEPRAAPRVFTSRTSSQSSAVNQPKARRATLRNRSAQTVADSVHQSIAESMASLLSSAEIAFASQITGRPIDLLQITGRPIDASAVSGNVLGSAAGAEPAASRTIAAATRSLQPGGQSAVRPSSSTSSNSSASTSTSSSRSAQTCGRAGPGRPRLRYRCAEPGAQLPRIDSADLLPTIQDLIGLLREIVASHPGHHCSCSPPATDEAAPAASHSCLSPTPARSRREPCGRPCAGTTYTPLPVTGETEPAALQPWQYPTPAPAPGRREPCRPIAGPASTPPPAPGAPVTRRHSLWPSSRSPTSSSSSGPESPVNPAPHTQAARPADCPALLHGDSEAEQRPFARRRRRAAGRSASPCRASLPLPSSPLSPQGSGNCAVCGRLAVTCRCVVDWERRWAPAPPGPGQEHVYNTLRHMLPASSDSEGEERSAGTGR